MKQMIAAIARHVHDLGGRALLVGGCVRDGLLGRDCCDIDCEVHGVEKDALRGLLLEFGEIDESGSAYGIYTIRGAGLDIALPRTETRTGPGHKDFSITVDPWLDPAQAAARRDFTVNAIMRDALTGEYVDPFGGMRDLKDGVLRAVPGEKFEEDPLRVLRGAQFAARFHLTPDGDTIDKMRRMDTGSLSASRVYAETKKALELSDKPDVFFRVLKRADALGTWFPELEALCQTPQNPKYHPEGDAFEHTMLTLNAAAEIRHRMRDSLAFMLAALCHDLGKAASARISDKGVLQAAGHEETGVPLCADMLARLGVSKSVIAYAQNMCRLHMRVHACYYGKAEAADTNMLFDEAMDARELAWLAVCDSRGTGKPREQADAEEQFVFERLSAYEEIVSGEMPDARMLIALGAAPGPGMKEALALARRLVLSGVDARAAAQAAAEKFKA